MRRFLTLALMMMMTIFVGCGSGNQTADNSVNEDITSSSQIPSMKTNVNGDLIIKMLNVGQGDAILIQTKSQNILIDTSDTDERDKLRNELKNANVTTLDRIILTHPHADHIGGVDMLMKELDVKEVDDNGMVSTSRLYTSYLKTIKSKKIKHSTLKDGDRLDFGNGVIFEVFYPTKDLIKATKAQDYKHDPNNESIVGKLVYKDFSMLFTGDAEKTVENDILNTKHRTELKSTILKAAHHGSKTSAGADYMKQVSPEVVVISAGEPDIKGGNTYGHPHQAALNSYIKAGVDKKNIYWTYKNGTITITTDGKNYSINPEFKEEWITQWLKRESK